MIGFRVLDEIDPAVIAFANTSGATNLRALSRYTMGIRNLGLWSQFSSWPMRPGLNAGALSTVYQLGGNGAGNMTLVNGPTWGAGGVGFNGTDQLGRVSDYLSDGTISVFVRLAEASATPTTDACIVGQYDTTLNERSWGLFHRGDLANDPYTLNRSSLGTSATLEEYRDGGGNSSVADRVLSSQWINGGGRSFWINKTLIATTPVGISVTSRKNSVADITLASRLGNNVPAAFTALTGSCLAIITGTITDAQREAITDLINAL